MTAQQLRSILYGCLLFNGGLLLLWSLLCLFALDWVYATQNYWFPMSREVFVVAMYGFIGLFKTLFLIFNAAPWLAMYVQGIGRPTSE